MLYAAPHSDSRRQRERDELGDVAVTRRREGSPAVQQRQFEQVPFREVTLGELLGLRPARHGVQRLEPSDLVNEFPQHVEPVRPVHFERREYREVVDAGDRTRDGLERLAARDGQVHAEVPHFVAQPYRLDVRLPAHRPRQARHRVGDVEQPRVGAMLLHGLPYADQDGNVAQRAVDAAGPDRVTHGLRDAVPGRHVEVDRHGSETPGRDAHDDEVRAVERGAQIGRRRHRGLRAHGVIELAGQRLHLGQRCRIDVLEHEVHTRQRRGPEEIGHQLGCPLIAAAPDDRHLGGHGATVQSRS